VEGIDLDARRVRCRAGVGNVQHDLEFDHLLFALGARIDFYGVEGVQEWAVTMKQQVGDLSQYPNETAANAASDALRLTINNRSQRNGVGQITVEALWKHYACEELPFKDFSTQDGYLSYAKNWVLPRWGRELLVRVKTVEVERWLREATVSNGTRAKIKCVMSALFWHAVRWEFTSTNPISSGIPVGAGGKRGPSVGVRVSAKRRRAPIVSSAEQVTLGLMELEFRDQLLVLLDGALGTRGGRTAILKTTAFRFSTPTTGDVGAF
jgi:hypothetical protein